MSLIRIILARVLFRCVVKLIEAEERAIGLERPMSPDRWRQ
jgi:hypothetical protein